MSLRQEYDALRQDWREGFSHDVWECAVSFLIIFLLSFGVALFYPPLREGLMGFYTQAVENSGILTEEGFSFAALLSSNIIACFAVCVYGMIPFIRLPALSLGLNAALIGVVAAQFQATGYSYALFFAGLLPHAIFEIPALLLSLAMGLRLCRHSTNLLRKRSEVPFWATLTQFGRLYLLVVLPLLLAGAAMETWVTPQVMTLFQ